MNCVACRWTTALCIKCNISCSPRFSEIFTRFYCIFSQINAALKKSVVNVSTQCLFYDVPSLKIHRMLQLLMHSAPRGHFLSQPLPSQTRKNGAKFCTVVINKHPAVVIMTFHVTALPWFTVWMRSKPAADGLAQLLPLKWHHAERFSSRSV